MLLSVSISLLSQSLTPPPPLSFIFLPMSDITCLFLSVWSSASLLSSGAIVCWFNSIAFFLSVTILPFLLSACPLMVSILPHLSFRLVADKQFKIKQTYSPKESTGIRVTICCQISQKIKTDLRAEQRMKSGKWFTSVAILLCKSDWIQQWIGDNFKELSCR